MNGEDIERLIEIALNRCKYEAYELEGDSALMSYVDLV